ncbi:TetR/AcrR family transcriptional regulator [Spirosoma telluris]|uniref:TetR/AcrR family transcriptional regulator n=1 Tax=Spirosoma telluris TaxID=2183553 RepID=UPI002FC374CB
MPGSTKGRILNASVRLFNEYGVDAVRLQQIAEEIGISVGNLAYHFKTKDAIIESVYEQVLDEFAHIFRQYLQAPN